MVFTDENKLPDNVDSLLLFLTDKINGGGASTSCQIVAAFNHAHGRTEGSLLLKDVIAASARIHSEKEKRKLTACSSGKLYIRDVVIAHDLFRRHRQSSRCLWKCEFVNRTKSSSSHSTVMGCST